MSDKPSIEFSQFVWEGRAAEHLRDGCSECRAGRCLADPTTGVVAAYRDQEPCDGSGDKRCARHGTYHWPAGER